MSPARPQRVTVTVAGGRRYPPIIACNGTQLRKPRRADRSRAWPGRIRLSRARS